MLTIATVQRELKKLAVLYQKPISEPEIVLMAHLWAEELGEMSEQELVAALRLHRRRSNFWPTLAEVFKAHADSRPKAITTTVTAEPERTEEDLRRNRIYAKMMLLSLKENHPLAKAFFSRELSWSAKDALARTALGDKYPEPEELSPKHSPKYPTGHSPEHSSQHSTDNYPKPSPETPREYPSEFATEHSTLESGLVRISRLLSEKAEEIVR